MIWCSSRSCTRPSQTQQSSSRDSVLVLFPAVEHRVQQRTEMMEMFALNSICSLFHFRLTLLCRNVPFHRIASELWNKNGNIYLLRMMWFLAQWSDGQKICDSMIQCPHDKYPSFIFCDLLKYIPSKLSDCHNFAVAPTGDEMLQKIVDFKIIGTQNFNWEFQIL